MLRVEKLSKYFPVKSSFLGRTTAKVYAVDDVSFSIAEGETLGLVGESGCGKSTLARTILRFHEPSAGKVFFQDEDLSSLSSGDMRRKRREMQMIFQDPVSSLNPRMTIESTLSEPFIVHKVKNKKEIGETIRRLLETVGL
jgi:oligopeptide transport system ATP-binding protein